MSTRDRLILSAKGFKVDLTSMDRRKYTREELVQRLNDYFDMMDDDSTDINGKRKAFTIEGLCTFLEISRTTLDKWKVDDNFKDIFEFVDQIVYDHNLTHTLAGVYKEQVSIRFLGLADKREDTIDANVKGFNIKDTLRFVNNEDVE